MPASILIVDEESGIRHALCVARERLQQYF